MLKINKITCKEARLDDLASLLYYFRHELALLKERKLTYSRDDAKEELSDYFTSEYEVYLADKGDKAIAYCILRVFDKTVWLEQLFVLEEARRNKYAGKLLSIANQRANDLGKETAFINVHPNNHKMIKFLASNDYDVLNLIEVRKLYNKEKINSKINVGENSFKY